ncbi:MAG: undecaprenyldiphospho-muramoylpentapeptide beta-N-acetylglucosaminyltransferase [Myxococcota bacterium]
MDVLIAGGGTGGHLFPGIALAQELRRRDADGRVLFVGTKLGIETTAVPRAGFNLELLPVSGLRRVGLFGFLLGMLRLPLAMLRALQLVRRFGPDVAVSVGGYAAGPAVLASRLLGVPCVVMEQNAVPGFTNKVLGRMARRIFAALPTQGFPASKVRILGNPVREDLLAVRESPYQPAQPLQLLIFGGSQGARALNEAMMAAAPSLATQGPELRIVHQTGIADQERVERAYRDAGLGDVQVVAFIDDMASAYRQASLVLCRAGATSIAELTVCGRPAILVPYPSAVDDHQTANALTLSDAGAAIHLPQSELTAERLVALLGKLTGDPALLRAMAAASLAAGKPEAVGAIADALEQEVKQDGAQEVDRV